MIAKLAALCLLLGVASAVFTTPNPNGIGDQLKRTFLIFKELPLTATQAIASGFKPSNNGTCVPGLGYPYAKDGKVSRGDSLKVWFNAQQQVTGLSMTVWGEVNALAPDWYQPVVGGDSDQYELHITYRDPSMVCDKSIPASSMTVGDRVIVNANTMALSVPVTHAQASGAGWTRGGCITGMGEHWELSLDVASRPNMTWVPDQMLPLVVMYNTHTGDLSGTFFAFPATSLLKAQLPVPLGIWELPILTSSLMCKNFCSPGMDGQDDCKWKDGNEFWNTMHVMYSDHSANQCNGPLANCVTVRL